MPAFVHGKPCSSFVSRTGIDGVSAAATTRHHDYLAMHALALVGLCTFISTYRLVTCFH